MQHANVSQHDAANLATLAGEAAKAAELDISIATAMINFGFISDS
jgi:hypothetical protein